MCIIYVNNHAYVLVVDLYLVLHLFRFNNEMEFIAEQTMAVNDKITSLELSSQIICITKTDDKEYYSLENLTKLSYIPTFDLIENKTSHPSIHYQKIWRFQRVFVYNEWFYLMKKDLVWTLQCKDGQLRIVNKTGLNIDDQKMYHFFNAGMYSDTKIKFYSANTENDSKFVLDSRGFLHLMSSNPEIPEITILLTLEVNTAACTQRKKFAGPVKFLGDRLESFDDVVTSIKDFCRNAI